MNPPQQTQTESSKAETPSQKLKPLIVEMTTELTSNHPSNIPEFLLNYLQQKNGYSNSGLTPSQRFELENLRRELLKYKKMEEHEKFIQEPKEQKEKGKNIPLPSKEIESEDDDDDIDFELDDEAKNKIRVGDKKRNAVCAEVKGSGMINEPKDNKDKDKDKDKEKENIKEKKNEIKLKYTKKNPEDENFIKAYLLRNCLFDSLEPDDMKKIIGVMEEKEITEGTIIIKQGEIEKNLYFIREGNAECTLNFEKPQIKDPKNPKIKKPKEYTPIRLVKEYRPGDTFCDLSLLYINKSPGTIKATSDLKVFTLDKFSYETIMQEKAERKNNINEAFLQKIDFLKVLTPEEQKKLSQSIKRGNFKKGDIIIKENEYGDVLYYLESGICKTKKRVDLGKKEIPGKDIKKGDLIGIDSFLKGKPREETVIAGSDDVKVVCLSNNEFNNLIGDIEDVIRRNDEIFNKYYPEVTQREEEERLERERIEKEKEEKKKKEEEDKLRQEQEEKEKEEREKKAKEDEEKKKKEEEERKKKEEEGDIEKVEEEKKEEEGFEKVEEEKKEEEGFEKVEEEKKEEEDIEKVEEEKKRRRRH